MTGGGPTAELRAALERLRPIIENSKAAFENPPDYNDPSLNGWRLEGLASGCRIGLGVIDAALRASDTSAKGGWSPEQLQNAYKYGVCMTCGHPRVPLMERNAEVVTTGIACPNGHPQD